jgi:hypothetical protein
MLCICDLDEELNLDVINPSCPTHQAKIVKDNWKERALKAEKRLVAVELLVSYAKDIVTAWPTLTIRTLGSMTTRVENLKQALGMLE